MRVLVTGATGLIGSAVMARLAAAGHEIVGVARTQETAGRGLVPARWVALDFADARDPAAWAPHLDGVDAVINCAGVLQDSPRDSTHDAHVTGPAALFAACREKAVRRVVHLSAIGIDRETPTEFSATKLAGEKALRSLDLDWVILRPSVVVGAPAYGGSALFRGLAALPIIPSIQETGPLQVVQLDDLVDTIAFFIAPDAPARVAVDVAGPERLTLQEVVRTYRRWLGFSEPTWIKLPQPLALLMYRLGDLAGFLGWRSPMRTTGAREIVRGATGDPTQWTKLTAITPKSLATALAQQPASVQERWFARLYFLKPLMIGIFALFWIVTGLISLGPGWEIGIGLLRDNGVGAIAPMLITAGALADIAIGLGIAVRRTSKLALYAALGLSLTYVVAGTILVPRLWIDPLGPMLKIWPILALNLATLAIVDER